jgi:hypothetical protein
METYAAHPRSTSLTFILLDKQSAVENTSAETITVVVIQPLLNGTQKSINTGTMRMETARKTLRSLAMAEMRDWEKYVTTGSVLMEPCLEGLKKC